MDPQTNVESFRNKSFWVVACVLLLGGAIVLLFVRPSLEPVSDRHYEEPIPGSHENPDGHSLHDPAGSDSPELADRDPMGDARGEDLPLTASFIENMNIITATSAAYSDRSIAVRGLGSRLTSEEILALYEFLLSPPPDAAGNRVYDRAVKNNILNLLRNQSEPPDGLHEVMARMYKDPLQDPAVRDYALQHLGAWHSEAPIDSRPVILDTLRQGVLEVDSSLGGTALLALDRLEHTETRESTAGIAEMAVEVVYNEHADDLSRVTALQVAAERAPSEVFDAAAEWSIDPSIGYPRRLSAIAALGAVGSPEAEAVLAQVADLGDPHLEAALAKAYRNLEESNTNAGE